MGLASSFAGYKRPLNLALVHFGKCLLPGDFFLLYNVSNHLKFRQTRAVFLSSLLQVFQLPAGLWSCDKLGHTHEREQKIKGDYKSIFAVEVLL